MVIHNWNAERVSGDVFLGTQSGGVKGSANSLDHSCTWRGCASWKTGNRLAIFPSGARQKGF